MTATADAHAPSIRRYEPRDHADVYDICIETSEAAGGNPDFPDPEIVPVVFAGAYLEFERDLAFVLDNGERVVGYIIGTADTRTFAERCENEWLPRHTERFPKVWPPKNTAEWFVAFLHKPDEMVKPELADYPAHLHTNILPPYQGKGYGKQMMRLFLDALRERGVKGVELSVLKENVQAVKFYERVGFEYLDYQPWPDSYKMGQLLS